jgi:hypothetical protein
LNDLLDDEVNDELSNKDTNNEDSELQEETKKETDYQQVIADMTEQITGQMKRDKLNSSFQGDLEQAEVPFDKKDSDFQGYLSSLEENPIFKELVNGMMKQFIKKDYI